MKRILFITAILFSFSFQSFAQGDVNSDLANYFSYQNENNDTAAFNLIKRSYLTVKETNVRDLNTLDKLISTIKSYTSYFVPCTPEEEEERGANECARLEHQMNTIETVILPESYAIRAEARLRMNDYVGALEDFDAAIKARPDNAAYYTNRGNVKYKMRDAEGAVADFNQSISLDSSNASVFYNKGMVLLKMKDFENAEKAFMTCTRLDPNNTKALYYKGLSQYQAGQGEVAIATFAEVNLADPTNDGAFFYTGLIHYKAKAFDKAQDSFSQATTVNPKNKKAWYYHGISAFNLQDKETACDSWNKALELGYEKANKMITEYCGE